MQRKKALWGGGIIFLLRIICLLTKVVLIGTSSRNTDAFSLRLQRDNKILLIINFMEVYLLIYSENSEGGDTITLNRKFSEGLLKDLKPLSQEKPGKYLFLTRLSMVQIF